MKKIIIILTIFLIAIIGIILFIYKDQSVAILGYHSFIESDKRIELNITDNMIMDISIF